MADYATRFRRQGEALEAVRRQLPPRSSHAIFEAVANRELTPEQGAAELMANDARRPWPERFRRWLSRLF